MKFKVVETYIKFKAFMKLYLIKIKENNPIVTNNAGPSFLHKFGSMDLPKIGKNINK